MYLIKLQDLFFKAPVGLYPEEKILGTDLVLQVELEINNDTVQNADGYVDYVRVYQLIADILKQGFDLLEQAAEEIIHHLFSMNDRILRILISIEKIHPPIKQFEGAVSVTISKSR